MEEKEYKNIIRRFRQRLNTEAGIRAGTYGLAAGLAAMAAVLFYGRLRYQSILMTEAAVVAAGLLLLVTLLCYFAWFRPKKKEVLARIDSLGLKERIITMEELKGEDTVIARKQRQDAKEHLAGLRAASMNIRLYIRPLICSLVLAVAVMLLAFVPFPEEEIDPLAQKNAQEMQIVDEMITILKNLVEQSLVNEKHRADINEIIDAMAMSFTSQDSTLTRTAKIATASKRLDMYESSEKAEVTLKKQQSNESSEAKAEIKEMESEIKTLSAMIKDMKDVMGTSIDVINLVEGTFWTPGGPSSGSSYEVEELPPEENQEETGEPQEGEEPGEGGEPPEGMEPGEGGEPQEGMEGNMNGAGGQTIFDPEQGQVGYGSVYEEYYQEILKALTEHEFSEEIRNIIEDYANSLE
jgi:hypothetical protein